MQWSQEIRKMRSVIAVIPNTKYHMTAFCGGRWGKCGLEDASKYDSEESKSDRIYHIWKRQCSQHV